MKTRIIKYKGHPFMRKEDLKQKIEQEMKEIKEGKKRETESKIIKKRGGVFTNNGTRSPISAKVRKKGIPGINKKVSVLFCKK